MKTKKGDIEFDTLVKLAIALLAFVIIIVLVFLLKDKSALILEKIKDLLRFGP